MLRKFEYSRKLVLRSIWLLVFLVCLGMAESRLNRQQCNNLLVKVDYEAGMRFINQSDIEKLMTDNGTEPVHGNRQKNIPLSTLEQRVRANKLVKDCQVYHDLDGNLVVEIEQEKPLARWINTSRAGEWRKSDGFYINDEGAFLPLSNRFSARVLMVAGSFFQDRKNLDDAKGRAVLKMINYLNEEPFWRAQVVQMNVAKDGNIDLYTALGDQRIEFGKAENIEPKLTKLRIFYEKVLATDWSRYSMISLKFHNQIVCE